MYINFYKLITVCEDTDNKEIGHKKTLTGWVRVFFIDVISNDGEKSMHMQSGLYACMDFSLRSK